MAEPDLRPGRWRNNRPAFAHASEAELARILDFYDVRWEYEPSTFPIGWNLDGDVVESFSPDFYLPDLDLFVELTTLKQKLVRKKNRKLRRLRELYPNIRIKLFYARDFRMLLLKFGRLALAPELSGTSGQATLPRAEALASIGGPPEPRTRGLELVAPGLELVALPAAEIDAASPIGPPLPEPAPGRRRGRRRRRHDHAPATTSPAASPSSGTDGPTGAPDPRGA